MAQFAIKDAGNIIMKSRVTGKPLFYTRALNKFNFKVDADSVYAKAKGSNYIAFDGAITATITMEQEVITFPQFSLILASDMVEESSKISKRAIGVADGSKTVTLANTTFVNGSTSAFEVEEDGVTIGKEIAGTFSNASGSLKFVATGELDEGTKVTIFYSTEKPKTKKIVVKDEVNASNYEISADIAVKTAEGKYMTLYATFFNCKAQRSIEFGLDAENPVNFQTVLDVLPNEKGEYVEFAFVEDAQDNVMKAFSDMGVTMKKGK